MPLYFPYMHPQLLSSRMGTHLAAGLRLLDPGLPTVRGALSSIRERSEGTSPDIETVRSALSPFDPRTARALLADLLRFGEEQANPGDALAQSLAGAVGALSPEGGIAVQAEVERSLLGVGGVEAADPESAALRQAQVLLLLAWSLEERMLDLRSVEERLKNAWSRLGQSVAAGPEVVDEDSDQDALALGRELSGLTLPQTEHTPLPWRKLLESFVLLMPGEALCTDVGSIADELAEAGIPEGPLEAISGAQRVYRAPLWRFLGLGNVPANKSWLASMVTLGVLQPGAKDE